MEPDQPTPHWKDQLKARISELRHNAFVSTSALSATAQVIVMAAGFVSAKILAEYLGREGVGYFNQFTKFIATATIFSSLGLTSGVTKYVAEFRDRPGERAGFISTGFLLVLSGTLVTSLLLMLFPSFFNEWTFEGKLEFSYLFVLFGVLLILTNLNFFVISVFNGLQMYRTVVMRNIYQACSALVLHLALTIWWGLPGALLGLVLTQSLIFVLLLPEMRHKAYLKPSELTGHFRREYVPLYAKFMVMVLAANLFGNLLQLQLQNNVIGQIGASALGEMTAVFKISSIYLNIATGIIGLYFLPKFAAEPDPEKLGLLLRRTLTVIVGFVVIGGTGFMLLKSILIPLFFKAEFLTATPLVKYQVCGDLFKGAGYVLSYLLIARGRTYAYLVAEIACGSSYYVISKLLLASSGIEALMIGYVVSNVLYLLILAVITFRMVTRGMSKKFI